MVAFCCGILSAPEWWKLKTKAFITLTVKQQESHMIRSSPDYSASTCHTISGLYIFHKGCTCAYIIGEKQRKKKNTNWCGWSEKRKVKVFLFQGYVTASQVHVILFSCFFARFIRHKRTHYCSKLVATCAVLVATSSQTFL